jgi:hypothetical protein
MTHLRQVRQRRPDVKLVSVLMLLGTMFALSTSPASAWWQFVFAEILR